MIGIQQMNECDEDEDDMVVVLLQGLACWI